MEKKQALGRVCKVLCFALVFCILLGMATEVLRDKTGGESIAPFYEEAENSLDVLFFGSSHIMCSIYPLTLWEQYGIASYDCCTSAQVLPQTYFQILDALHYQSPSLVVLDVSGVYFGDILVGSESYVHTQLDNMKTLSVKIAAIQTLIEPEDRLEYYFPILLYHDRWAEVAAEDFQKISSITNGARVYTDAAETMTLYHSPAANETAEISDVPEEYLRKCIEYCQEQGIEVLLLNTPSNVDPDAQRRYNAVEAIAEEYGVRYLNLLHCYDEMDFDPLEDLHDNNHCAMSGALKVTAYVGQYILEHYDVATHTGEEAYAQWDTDAAQFRQGLTEAAAPDTEPA